MIKIIQLFFSFISKHRIWLVGVSFVLFQFCLQLSSGVIISTIMHDLNITALMAGLLSASFYIVYTALQIPIGMLFDRKNTRRLLTYNVFLCSIGCFVFSASTGFVGLFLGRVIIGTGSAFAFIGLSHLLRQYYPLRKFALIIGISETLGFIATTISILVIGSLILIWGWRSFINIAGGVGLFISFLCWQIIPNNPPPQHPMKKASQALFCILANKQNWINGFFVGLCFTVVTAFGSLWSVPFLQLKLHCNVEIASYITALFFLGTAVSCPLFGWLSMHLNKRRPLLWGSSLSTALLMLVILYLPTEKHWVIGAFMFLMGACCGAYMLAYTIANELADKDSLSTSTGFTNTLAVITTPLLQPLIGWIMDLSNKTGNYQIIDYQIALLTIPFSLVLASLLVAYLPETKS